MGIQTIDLTINENELQKGALDILKVLRPTWRPEDVRFMNFTEGITNKLIGCYHVSDSEKADGLVIRVYGEKTDLIIDRNEELTNMQILYAAGCGAPALARFNNGLAYGYVTGICLDVDNIRTPQISRLVSKAMVQMHLINIDNLELEDDAQRLAISQEPFVFPRARQWIDISAGGFDDPQQNERYKQTIPDTDTLRTELNQLEKELPRLGSPVVYCHNDLLVKNIVYNMKEEKVTFIDFEYGAYNYEAYDLGSHFCEWAGVDTVDYKLYPTRDEQLPWLRTYLEQKAEFTGRKASVVTERDVEVLYVQANKFALMSHLFWGIWALIQAKYSTIDFDYLEYSKCRLDEYFAKRDQFLSLQMPE